MIIVEVYSPSVDASYDFQIDENMNADDAAKEIAEIIARKNGSEVGADMSPSLYDSLLEHELDQSKTIKENDITNGRRLLLI